MMLRSQVNKWIEKCLPGPHVAKESLTLQTELNFQNLCYDELG